MKLMFPFGMWLLLVPAGIAIIYFLRMPRRRILVADIAPWLQVARAGQRANGPGTGSRVEPEIAAGGGDRAAQVLHRRGAMVRV